MHILQVKNLSKVKGTDEGPTWTVGLPKFMLLTIKATLISIGKAHLQQRRLKPHRQQYRQRKQKP